MIELYEKKDLPGILLFIDFEKAFDFLEGKYLFKVLDLMNFGPMFQKWVHISRCVINNSFAWNFFSLETRVRRGCPLSGLLFILAVEVLAQAIRQDENICGLKIRKTELKLSLYADDLTAFVRDENSKKHLLNLLNDYRTCSGLKINTSKTEGMWLGNLKSNIGTRSPFQISWPDKYVIALAVAFTYDPLVSNRINFVEKLMTLKKVLNQWLTRNFTLIGKICIIKTLAISKLVYYTSVLLTPPDFPKHVNESCFKFIWNFKPDKIKRNTIIGPLDKGGLNMIDFKMIDKALKAAWVKRLYDATPNSKWCSLFSSEMSRYGGPFLFECNFNARDLNIAAHIPSFYEDVLNAWQELHSKNPSHTIKYMNEIVWNNRFIKIDKKPVFYSSWYKRGVTKISHLLDENNRFLSRSDFQQKYGLSVNFLMYNGLLEKKQFQIQNNTLRTIVIIILTLLPLPLLLKVFVNDLFSLH